MAACTKRLVEEKNELGQKSLKRSTMDCFLFNNWFSLKKSSEAAASIGVYFIDMEKTINKVFCKATIKVLTKDWPGGSYIVLIIKPMVPGERPLLAIRYK